MMSQRFDYAKMENAAAWLRHPILGDPSFDTFEKVGDTLHTSQPPYEWAVNASLFRDPVSGWWYCFPGIYHFGYAYDEKAPSDFLIYRSRNEGQSWEYVAKGSEVGFEFFSGHPTLFDSHPDVVMFYEEETGRYWLAYDGSTSTQSWELAHTKIPADSPRDSGSALAWAKSPEGPFHRLDAPVFSNKRSFGRMGRFDRGYATTVMKRERDWIAFILFDSHRNFSWALGCATAPGPDGPWSPPHMLLSVDRGEYFPAPVEFYPCFAHEGRVYAPATSLGMNRSYQALFACELEQAHNPDAWTLAMDGNVFHSRPLPDEKYGIWGQTFHGFVHEGTLTVVYPSKDERNFGTISIASRPWDAPLSDGFAFSGHNGASIAPLLRAYRAFSLSARVEFTGSIELLFGCAGIFGPNISASDAEPDASCFASCHALVLQEDGRYRLVSRDAQGGETVLLRGETASPITDISLRVADGQAALILNDIPAGNIPLVLPRALPLAVAAHRFSWLTCTRFAVTGDIHPCTLRYNAWDALLSAGENRDHWQADSGLAFRSPVGLIASGKHRGKWNFIGSAVTLYAPKSPKLGSAEVWIDGHLHCVIDLHSDQDLPSQAVFDYAELVPGRHCLMLTPHEGTIALDMLKVTLTLP